MSRLAPFALVALACSLLLLRADDKPKALPDDLKLIPADAGVFASVRIADFLASDAGKKLLPTARKLFEKELAELEKAIGVPLADVERLTAVELGGMPGIIVRTKKAYDLEKLTGPKPKKFEVAGKTVYTTPSGATLYPASDTVYALAGERLGTMIEAAKSDKAHPLADALKLAAGKHHLVIGGRPEVMLGELKLGGEAQKKQLSRDELLDKIPVEMLPYKPLLRAKWAALTADAGKGMEAELVARFDNESDAGDAEVAALTARYVGRQLVQLGVRQVSDEMEGAKELKKLAEQAQAGLKGAKVKRDKNLLRASVSLDVGAEVITTVAQRMRLAAARMQATNDLKQIGLAMHNYHDANGAMPLAASVDKNGKPLLSWRVAILPYIEQDNLYKEFKLDEPWDSEHNKKLLDKMPAIYGARLGKTKEKYSTYYRVFIGDDAPFDLAGNKKVRLAQIADGTSNTIMVVEAADAVPWTKPEGLEYDANKAVPKLGAQFGDVFLVAMFDGSVRSAKKKIADATLRALITPNGGEVIGNDW